MQNLIKVNAYSLQDDKIIEMNVKDCQFDYRESLFKKDKNFIVLDAEFKLELGNKEDIKKQMLELTKKRICSQPKFSSAGCSFKNIVVTDEILKKLKLIDPNVEEKIKGGKIGSAFIIDKAGLKGYKIGGAQLSEDHANFIVKASDDTKADHVLQLISYIKQQVRDKYGIQLQEEIQYVGF